MIKKIVVLIAISACFCLPISAYANYSSLTAGITQVSIIKKYKDISRNPIQINKLQKAAHVLNHNDISIISKYVFGAVRGEDTFLLINCCLRGNLDKYISKKDINKPLENRLKFYADNLASVIAKTKLPANTILYYSIDDKGFITLFHDKEISDLINKPVNQSNLMALKNKIDGTKYTEKSFLLTVYDINYAQKTKFVFEINAPKNLQAVLIDKISGKENKEVLINSGYKWKVTDISIVNKHNKSVFYKINLKLIL